MQKGYHGRYQIAVLNCTSSSPELYREFKINYKKKIKCKSKNTKQKHEAKSKAMLASLEGRGGFWVNGRRKG